MLVYSMTASIDGFICDRDGDFAWTAPSDELFQFQLEHVSGLGAYLMGRRLYETMSVWETDPSFRSTDAGARFADVWAALPKVVFSHSTPNLIGNARLATASVAEEIAVTLAGTDADVSIGGATLTAQAIELDLVDELRILRDPIVVGGGTPLLPELSEPLAFELAENRAFSTGVVFERYRRAR